MTHSLIAGRYDGPAAVRLIPELAQKKQQQADEAKAKFAADDMPAWNPATFLRYQDVAPGLRNVVLGVEIRCEV